MIVASTRNSTRHFWGFGVMASGAFACLPGAAVAEDSGLPQMNAAMFPEQIFWLAVTFAVLYVLMARVALPRVASTQDNRAKVLSSEIESARQASEAAHASMAAIDKSLAAARAQAQEDTNAKLAEAAAAAVERQATQERDLQRRLHRAEADIAVAREAAMRAIGASADELAALMVAKCLGDRPAGQSDARKRMSS